MAGTTYGFDENSRLMACVAILLAGIHCACANVSCPFTSDFCGWTKFPSNNWQLTASYKGLLPPPGLTSYAVVTGPVSTTMRLESETMTILQPTTLSFRYVQRSPGQCLSSTCVGDSYAAHYATEKLTQLWIVSSNGSSHYRWADKNAVGAWEQAAITLQPATNIRLQFRFPMLSFMTASGITDIVLQNENEVVQLLPTATTTPITPVSTELPSAYDQRVSCTFRAGMCGWVNDPKNLSPWRRTASLNPGSPIASTDEFYMFIEAERGNGPTSGKLIISPFRYSGVLKIQYWYRFGTGTTNADSLVSVKVQKYEGVNARTYGETIFAYGPSEWRMATTSIDFIEEVTQLHLGATLSDGQSLAVDEIRWAGDLEEEVAYENSTPATHIPTPKTTGTTTSSNVNTDTEPEDNAPCWTAPVSPCASDLTLMVSCTRGQLNFADDTIDAFNAEVVEFTADSTLKCRNILSNMQQWLLNRRPAYTEGITAAGMDTLYAQCTGHDGLKISSNEDPELSAFSKILYRIDDQKACRATLISFVETLTTYALA